MHEPKKNKISKTLYIKLIAEYGVYTLHTQYQTSKLLTDTTIIIMLNNPVIKTSS